MRRYVNGAHGREVGVFAHRLNIMLGLNPRGLQSKLLITPLSK